MVHHTSIIRKASNKSGHILTIYKNPSLWCNIQCLTYLNTYISVLSHFMQFIFISLVYLYFIIHLLWANCYKHVNAKHICYTCICFSLCTLDLLTYLLTHNCLCKIYILVRAQCYECGTVRAQLFNKYFMYRSKMCRWSLVQENDWKAS